MSDRDLPPNVPEVADLRRRLDALRPLGEDQLRETAVVLNDGVTIGGKTVREHLDAKSYRHMLDLAQGRASIDEEVIKDLHAYATTSPRSTRSPTTTAAPHGWR